MARRTDPEETPQPVTFQPWRIRIAVAIVFFVLIVVASALVPDGPYLLTTGPIFLVGSTAYSLAANRSVALRLDEQAVEIRQGWRKQRIPYEQITEVAAGPRIEWWRIGRCRLDDMATGHLMGDPACASGPGRSRWWSRPRSRTEWSGRYSVSVRTTSGNGPRTPSRPSAETTAPAPHQRRATR